MTSFPHRLSERTLAWKTGKFPFRRCLQCLVPALSHLSLSCRHKEGHVCVERWGGHVFQASRAPQTMLQENTLSVFKLYEASKVPEAWTWKKTLIAHLLAPQALPALGCRLAWLLCWDHHTAACLSPVPSLLRTTRWHCRFKWSHKPSCSRWGSGAPHLGVKRTSVPICSFSRWSRWGSETRCNLLGELRHRTEVSQNCSGREMLDRVLGTKIMKCVPSI